MGEFHLFNSMLGTGVSGVVAIIWLAGLWQVMTKTGREGWVALIPVYNIIQVLRAAGRPWWWLLLAPIPVVGIIVVLVAHIDLARAFSKGIVFAIGLTCLPFIFFPILGFGGSSYTRPAGA